MISLLRGIRNLRSGKHRENKLSGKLFQLDFITTEIDCEAKVLDYWIEILVNPVMQDNCIVLSEEDITQVLIKQVDQYEAMLTI